MESCLNDKKPSTSDLVKQLPLMDQRFSLGDKIL